MMDHDPRLQLLERLHQEVDSRSGL